MFEPLTSALLLKTPKRVPCMTRSLDSIQCFINRIILITISSMKTLKMKFLALRF